MKYGINMLLWTDNVCTEQIQPLFKKISDCGYDGVEVPIFSDDVKAFTELGRTLDSLGLGRTAVTVCSAEADPMSDDPAIRRKAVDTLKRTLDCCAAAGATHLVGPLHSALGTFSGKPATDTQIKHAADSLREVSAHAASCKVVLAIEYLNRFEAYLLNNAEQTVKFLKLVGHPNCRMMYDTFHAHIEEKDSAAAIRLGGSQIVHVHISENDRSTPGKGQVNWKRNFSALAEIEYDGWFMIEAFGLALPALAAATKIWRRMFESEEQLMRDGLAFMKKGWTEAAQLAKTRV